MSTALLENIETAGVVGAGGAGFPTHVKFAAHAPVLIVNAAECEPLIRVDQELLKSHTDEFFEGLAAAAQCVKAERVVIALKAKHTLLISELQAEISHSDDVELFLLGDYYPAGDEHILVKDVLNKVVPRGGIPLAVGAIVSNVETLINIARAEKSSPVTTSFVTVAGDVPSPATFELPVGMSYREALKLAGVTSAEGKAVIDGGPLMGSLVSDLDAPLTKTTKAVLLLNADGKVVVEKAMTDEQILRQSRTACLQCQKCTDLCPRDLLGHTVLPHVIMRIANYGIADYEGLLYSLGCSECGACALYACPSNLSPRRVNIMIKQQLAQAGIKSATDEDPAALSFIDYRKIPTKRLIARLGLVSYDRPAPLLTTEYQPQQVSMLLKQHVGAPARAVVKVGETVRRGDTVGHMEDGKMGARVHASIDGKVAAVTDSAVTITRD